VEYCENMKECRHCFIVRYFGEDTTKMTAEQKKELCVGKTRCDICRDPAKVARDKTKSLAGGSSTRGSFAQRESDGYVTLIKMSFK
jgi:superfamily II DNA helicase RecQ